MTKLYVACIPRIPPFDHGIFQKYLTQQIPSGLVDWAHYLPGTYFIASTMNIRQLTEKIAEHVGKHNIFVAPFRVEDVQGYLTKEAWDWMMKYISSN